MFLYCTKKELQAQGLKLLIISVFMRSDESGFDYLAAMISSAMSKSSSAVISTSKPIKT